VKSDRVACEFPIPDRDKGASYGNYLGGQKGGGILKALELLDVLAHYAK